MRRDRGSGGLGPVLLILAIMVVIGLSRLPPGTLTTPRGMAMTAAFALAFVWLEWKVGALPFVDALWRAFVARGMAKRLGGTLTRSEERVWGGGSATCYTVAWSGPDRGFELEFHISGAIFRASFAGGSAKKFDLDTFQGPIKTSTAETEAFLDPATRQAIEAIDALGGRRHLSFGAGEGWAHFYKHTALSRRQARRMVELGTPVLARAAALLSAGPPAVDEGPPSR